MSRKTNSAGKAPAKPAPRRSAVRQDPPHHRRRAENPVRSGGERVPEGELADLIGYALRRAQLRVFEDFYATLSVVGITPARFSTLSIIDANPGISQTVLAQTLDIARSGVVILIDTLEKLALVSREPISTDKRAYALHLTAGGKTALLRIRKQVAIHEARVCAHLGKAEKRLLLDMLARIGTSP